MKRKSHISEPALELHNRAAPSVGGIAAQLVQPQGEIPKEGRTEKKLRKENDQLFTQAKTILLVAEM